MQTYLPLIKALLSEWYLFTLNNALYAAVLAIAVWLLTAMFYSIRIAAIKRKKVASEKVGAENLHTAQQQLQHAQEELAAATLQMEKAQSAAQDESQRALALEQLSYQRNQQIAGIIQSLATSVDLGERPLLATEDIKADLLWQQHDKVITQLINRLRTEQQAKIELQQTCQAETAKAAEKEALVAALQSTLDNHTHQLSKLEHALEEQKSMLQQQSNTQQALSDTLKKYQPDVRRPTAPEPETIQPVTTWQQPMQAEASPTIEAPLFAQPTQHIQAAQIHQEPQAAPTWQVEEIPTESVTAVGEVESLQLVLDENFQPVVKEIPAVSPDIKQQPVAPAKGSLGKIKNLFGKKQQPVKTEPQWAATESDETLSSDTEQQPDAEIPEKANNKTGKLKGFYSKFRSKDK